VRDSFLEIWLTLLVKQIDRTLSPPPWLQDVREQWHIATMGFNGCVPTVLDEHLVTPERRAVVLSLSEQAMRHLESHGPSLSNGELVHDQAAFFAERGDGVSVLAAIVRGTSFWGAMRWG
jgi:hypothetical protein